MDVIGNPASLQLSVITVGADPAAVLDSDVPVLTVDAERFYADQWDLTTMQILPYLDGFNHISKVTSTNIGNRQFSEHLATQIH